MSIMKKKTAILALSLIPFIASAETISGHYSSSTPTGKGDVTFTNKRTGKSTTLDKKGNFSLKNADPEKDTLVVFTVSRNRTTFLSMDGCVEFLINEEDDFVDVVQKKAPFVPDSEYGGQMLTKESLEKTGESMTLAAVYVKVPKPNVSTSFTGSQDPLFFLDGLQTSDISTLPLSEVAYVEYVKPSNPECASMGAKGANGMILVTSDTKYKTSNPKWDEPKEFHKHILTNNKAEGSEGTLNK